MTIIQTILLIRKVKTAQHVLNYVTQSEHNFKSIFAPDELFVIKEGTQFEF